MGTSIEVSSVSWIDQKNLPPLRLVNLLQAGIGGKYGWDDRAVIGLIATSNPAPPTNIQNIETFRLKHQFRSLASTKIKTDLSGCVGMPILDPGWTPPYSKAKLSFPANAKNPPPKALKEHAGESSALSTVIVGKQSPISILIVPPNATVIANMIVKFRAGAATNQLGLDEADSPYHVPWVWCETMIVKVGNKTRLLGCGSAFPSHAWYVNGQQIATTLQKMVHANPNDPTISTGRPSSLPRLKAEDDKSVGTITSHIYTVSEGLKHDVELKQLN